MAAAKDKTTKRRPTVRDVAAQAGVSVGTVSHVLNDSKTVSEAARDAVMCAVAELDYRPNSLARSLIARRPRDGGGNEAARTRLICVGYISIDHMVRIDDVPAPGARVTSQSIEKMLGGPAANVAAFAAGFRPASDIRVEMVSRMGQDADSHWALEELAQRGIDASGILQRPGDRLSRCIVLVGADGQRTIINEPFQVPVDLLARHLAGPSSSALQACVHFDGFHLEVAERAGRELQEAGYLLSLHPAGLERAPRSALEPQRLLETFDLLFLDRPTFARIAEQAPGLDEDPGGIFALSPGPRCRAVLLTRGEEGAVLLRPDHAPIACSAPRVEMRDATGAGDAFAGIFLASWLATGEAETALHHAVHGAALSVTAIGAQGRLPKLAEISDPVPTAAGA